MVFLSGEYKKFVLLNVFDERVILIMKILLLLFYKVCIALFYFSVFTLEIKKVLVNNISSIIFFQKPKKTLRFSHIFSVNFHKVSIAYIN